MAVSYPFFAHGSHETSRELTRPTLEAINNGYYDREKVQGLREFQKRIDSELLNHRVIENNPYSKWFALGEQNIAQVQNFIIQFSVFSNQFLIAQLLKMLAADSLEEMHASKEILINELGVVFNSPDKRNNHSTESEKEFGGLTGSIEGGVFHFRAAHFELLIKTARHLNISFSQMGKRKFGTKETLFFCDELQRLYGSDDYQTSAAASYAVENWAAAGFWDELLEGLKIFRDNQHLTNMPLAFFSWHSKLEANHARHTQEELEAFYFENDVNTDLFISAGNDMLDGVYTFWKGLDSYRDKIH